MSTKQNLCRLSYFLKIAVLSPILSTKRLSTTALHGSKYGASRKYSSKPVGRTFFLVHFWGVCELMNLKKVGLQLVHMNKVHLCAS